MELDITRNQAIETAIAAGIIVAGVLVAWAVVALLRRVVHHYTRSTETQLDESARGRGAHAAAAVRLR